MRRQRLQHVGELDRPPDGLADPAHPLRVGVDDRDRTELVEGPSAAIVAGWIRSRASATSPATANDPPWLSRIIATCSSAVARPYGERGCRGGADHVRLADQPEQVGEVAAAGPLDVVGVDRPAADRGDGVLELRRLVEAVGVEADRDVLASA